MGFVCKMCPKAFKSARALAVHARHGHQQLAVARFYADGSVCRSCQREYHSRPRLLLHFASVPRCLTAAQMSSEPLTEEQVHDLDSRSRAWAAKSKAWTFRLLCRTPSRGPRARRVNPESVSTDLLEEAKISSSSIH